MRPVRIAACAVLLATLAGCSNIEPWVKPYERQHFADIIMSNDRDPIQSAYMSHVKEAREGARGADAGALP